MQDLKCVFSFC